MHVSHARCHARATILGRGAPRLAVLALALGGTLATAACSGSAVSSVRPAATSSEKPASGATADAAGTRSGAGKLGTMGNGEDMPVVPAVVVPDITAFDEASSKIADSFGDLGKPGSGVTVTGARCDSHGTVINRAALNLTTDGKGAGQVVEAGSSARNNGDGSGEIDQPPLHMVLHADGSGTLDDAALHIQVNKDGTGSYDEASLHITIGPNGTATHEDAAYRVVNHGDGSGEFTQAATHVVNHGDGSGEFTEAATHVVNHGDGTGTFDEAATHETRRMDPLPKLPPAGRFPRIQALKPLGKSCGILIRLDEKILFDFDKAELRPGAAEVLDKVAEAAGDRPGAVKVDGHTDSVGSDSYNLELSKRRAQAVADALDTRGVDGPITAKGYGETHPVAPNTLNGKDNPVGRQANRRVEVLLP